MFSFFLCPVAPPRYDGPMPNTKSTSVRIDQEAIDRLRRLSDHCGVSVAKLLTLAVGRFVDQVESNGELRVPLGQVAEDRSKYGTEETRSTK